MDSGRFSRDVKSSLFVLSGILHRAQAGLLLLLPSPTSVWRLSFDELFVQRTPRHAACPQSARCPVVLESAAADQELAEKARKPPLPSGAP